MRRVWRRFYCTSRNLHSVNNQKPWRDAASLIIAAPANISAGSKPLLDYNILFLKRIAKSSFPNSYVYPGGVLDKADTRSEWIKIFETVDPNFSESVSKDFFVRQNDGKRAPLFPGDEDSLRRGHLPNEIAFRICAIRESFEESGLLLLTDDIENRRNLPNSIHAKSLTSLLREDEVEKWRSKVHNDANEFMNLCKDLKMVPDIWSLKEWSEWLTPLFSLKSKTLGKRFDTVFYACCLKEAPSYYQYDKVETSESKWISPVDLIQMFMSEDADLVPPQIIGSLKMLNFQTLENLSSYINERSLKGMCRTMPYLFEAKDGKVIVLPGDDLYPEKADELGIYTNERKKLDLTVAEIMSSEGNKYRFPVGGDRTKLLSSMQCNVEMKYGKVSPVIIKDGKIPTGNIQL